MASCSKPMASRVSITFLSAAGEIRREILHRGISGRLSRYPLRGPWFGFSFGCVETDLVNASRRRLPTKSLDRSHARQFHQGANGVLTIAQRTVQAMPRH